MFDELSHIYYLIIFVVVFFIIWDCSETKIFFSARRVSVFVNLE